MPQIERHGGKRQQKRAEQEGAVGPVQRFEVAANHVLRDFDLCLKGQGEANRRTVRQPGPSSIIGFQSRC